MAKKTQEVATRGVVENVQEVGETELLTVPDKLTPAAVVGVNTILEIAHDKLPEEFQGQELEVLQTGFAPTVKWVNPGNFVGGVFIDFLEDQGPNESRMYNFRTKKEGKPFGVWGTTVLDRAFDLAIKTGQVKPGSLVMITYLGDVPADQNNCKMFHMAVARTKASA